MRDFLAAAGELGGLVGCHCELGDMVAANTAALLAAGKTGPEYHPVSRPNEVEALAVRRFLELGREADGLPWVVHLSTREGLHEIDAARAGGQRVLVETCPQYLTLTEEVYRLPDFLGAKYVCSPPIRSRADVDALSAAVEDGRIDILSTDHCSFNFKGQKELGRGDFTKIPNGLPGVEFRPAVVWARGVAPGHITPADMCRLMCETPAKAFGLWGRKGALAPGFDADIVVWDPNWQGVVDPSVQETACDNSPWEGMALSGRAKAVYLRGEKCAEDGRCIRRGRGEYLRRKPAML
jgi:dihydropyrimidinase